MLINLQKNFLFSFTILTMYSCFGQQQSNQDSLYLYTRQLILNSEFEEALPICLRKNDELPKFSKEKTKWLIFTGSILRRQNEFDKALPYFKESYYINLKNNDSVALVEDHVQIGRIFHHKLKSYRDSLSSKIALNLKDSILFYYNKNLDFEAIKGAENNLAHTYDKLAFIYSDYKQLDSAKYFINKTIELKKQLFSENSNQYLSALSKLGLIYIHEERYQKAEDIYLDINQKAQDSTQLGYLNNLLIATGNLGYIYEQTQQYKKAYEYSEKQSEISELITKKQRATEIRTIEAKYNEDKARAEEKTNTVKAEKEKERSQYLLAATGLISLAIILFGTVLYRNTKLKAKNLSLNLIEQELNQQKTLRVLQEKNQSKLLNATLDGRETERKDIAQTLHDSVSALLSSANMHLQVVKKKSTGAVAELDKSQRIIDEASGKVRDLSHKLISAVLLKFGLEHAVYDICEKYSNQDLEFELESEDKIPRFEQGFEIKIHNIIEECINNIMKHSKASEASVVLLLTNNTLHVTIKDNGVGFDASKISPSSGIGLSQIKARIENMEGIFDIDSKINKGTTIVMEVPVEYT